MDHVDLERLIDEISLAKVLDMLVGIAYGKAEHLESNWQDARSAKVWARVAKAIDKVQAKVQQEGI